MIPHNTPLCAGNHPVGISNSMDVEGEQNPATAYTAPSIAASTAASTAAARARPTTSSYQRGDASSTPVAAAAAAAAAGTATGANVAATALVQQPLLSLS